MNVDAERLGRIAQAAFDSVAGDRRWEVAIAKAKRQIEENPQESSGGRRGKGRTAGKKFAAGAAWLRSEGGGGREAGA